MVGFALNLARDSRASASFASCSDNAWYPRRRSIEDENATVALLESCGDRPRPFARASAKPILELLARNPSDRRGRGVVRGAFASLVGTLVETCAGLAGAGLVTPAAKKRRRQAQRVRSWRWASRCDQRRAERHFSNSRMPRSSAFAGATERGRATPRGCAAAPARGDGTPRSASGEVRARRNERRRRCSTRAPSRRTRAELKTLAEFLSPVATPPRCSRWIRRFVHTPAGKIHHPSTISRLGRPTPPIGTRGEGYDW